MDRLASGLAYPEGPVLAPDGSVVLVELGGGAVRRLAVDGSHVLVALLGGSPNGAALDASGDLLVCNNGGKHPPAPSTGDVPGAGDGTPALQRVALGDGVATVVTTEVDGEGLSAPNDICADGAGGFWFTDPSWVFLDDGMAGPGAVCHLDPSGTARRVHTGLRFPNGLALDATGTQLYVTESSTGDVWSFAVHEPGRLAAPRPFASCGSGALPDGMAIDADGRVLVAGHGTGCLHVFAPTGEALPPVELGADLGLSNLCFGGGDLTTVFVTAAATGEVYAGSWSVPGLALRR